MGQVLAYRRQDGTWALFVVVCVDAHKVGTAPVLRRLHWNRSFLPSPRKLRRLKFALERPTREATPELIDERVARLRKKDPDWQQAGFELIGHIDLAGGAVKPGSYLTWELLKESLDSDWNNGLSTATASIPRPKS